MKNCPNCGAPIELNSGDSCPYCGTPYYDLSCIPVNKPFVLRLNVGDEKHPKIICTKVITTGVSITADSYTTDVYYGNKKYQTYEYNPQYTFDMTFKTRGEVKYKEKQI